MTKSSFEEALIEVRRQTLVENTRSTGPGSCPSCHITYSSSISAQLGNLIEEDDTGADVVCTMAGTFWSVINWGTSRFIQAYYKCTNWTGGQCAADAFGFHPYARCNRQNDLCDTVELDPPSPVKDGGWPQYGLFNAAFFNTPFADICKVGTNGTRADNCYSPDPHP